MEWTNNYVTRLLYAVRYPCHVKPSVEAPF